MMRYKYSRLIDALCIFALLGASACSKQEEADVPSSSFLSDTEITLSLSDWTPMVESRAILFEDNDDLLDKKKGGGSFTLYTYLDSDDRVYMDGVWARYFDNPEGDSEWRMHDDNGLPIKYYWPNSEELNFFAFMPDKKYNGKEGYEAKETYVEVLDGYSKENGKQFHCTLPFSVDNEKDPSVEKTQEFIYAYAAKRTKQKDPVQLKFKHPFALINFKLKAGSYRMTVKEFKFSNIYLEGTFSTAKAEWDYADAKKEYTAGINKRVPNDVNYNTYLSDWFVVIPQDLNGVKLTLTATRALDGKDEPITGTFNFVSDNKWEPGHKYTYTISYGDNQEEIYFNVAVEEWTIGYEQNIEVE